MRLDKHAHLAVAVFAAFMGSAATAAPASALAFSSPLNAERTPMLTLAKQQKKASPAEVCAAKCDKGYRYCYSQGNQIGKPYVTGGQPCDEQKLMCMRACPT